MTGRVFIPSLLSQQRFNHEKFYFDCNHDNKNTHTHTSENKGCDVPETLVILLLFTHKRKHSYSHHTPYDVSFHPH